jgi:hypothetical protein
MSAFMTQKNLREIVDELSHSKGIAYGLAVGERHFEVYRADNRETVILTGDIDTFRKAITKFYLED